MSVFWAWLSLSTCTAHVIQNVLGSVGSSISAPETKAIPFPLIIWHGLGDKYVAPRFVKKIVLIELYSSYEAEGIRSVGALAEDANPGTFVYYIRLDDDASADRTATFLGNLTVQIEKVCADLASHPILSKAPAINGLGFSQGGQFLRAYVERCNFPRVANLVTFGSQHNGISDFQGCADSDWLCRSWDGFLKRNTWSHFVQSRLVPAQYYRKPDDLKSYLKSSNFLADINNERKVKNITYKENMMKLEKFVMYMFKDDKTVVPKQSAWFDELDSATGAVIRLQDRKIYQEDWIGLRWLDKRNRLEFLVTPGEHMQLTSEVLVEAFQKYFSPRSKSEFSEDSVRNTE